VGNVHTGIVMASGAVAFRRNEITHMTLSVVFDFPVRDDWVKGQRVSVCFVNLKQKPPALPRLESSSASQSTVSGCPTSAGCFKA
jgi:hypothetical protein